MASACSREQSLSERETYFAFVATSDVGPVSGLGLRLPLPISLSVRVPQPNCLSRPPIIGGGISPKTDIQSIAWSTAILLNTWSMRGCSVKVDG